MVHVLKIQYVSVKNGVRTVKSKDVDLKFSSHKKLEDFRQDEWAKVFSLEDNYLSEIFFVYESD